MNSERHILETKSGDESLGVTSDEAYPTSECSIRREFQSDGTRYVL